MRIPGLDIVAGNPVGVAAALDALPWRSTRHEGIEWMDIAAQADVEASPAVLSSSGTASETVLIRMAPGCGYPAHRHIGAEDVLVLAGGYRDGDGRSFTAGEFVRYPAGSIHAPVALADAVLDEEGQRGDAQACVLFAVAHGGTEVVKHDS